MRFSRKIPFETLEEFHIAEYITPMQSNPAIPENPWNV